jgi:hypothetical protein
LKKHIVMLKSSQMSDLARRLRDGRESLGVSLNQAEYDTKIRRRYIEAIESGDYLRLPDGLSARGFIRNYARYLGMDQAQALADFEAEVGVPIIQAIEVIPPPPSRAKAQSRYTQMVHTDEIIWRGQMPSDDKLALDRMADEDDSNKTPSRAYINSRRDYSDSVTSFKLNAPKSRTLGNLSDGLSTFRQNKSSPAISATANTASRFNPQRLVRLTQTQLKALVMGLVGTLALIIFVIFGIPALRMLDLSAIQKSLGVISATNQPATPIFATPIIVGNAPPPAQAPVPAQTASTPVVIPTLTLGGMRLAIEPHEHAWLRVKTDGNVVYEGIPSVGNAITWNAKSNVTLETGNAGAFDILINGARMGSLGNRNTVIRQTFNPQGQIVPNP